LREEQDMRRDLDFDEPIAERVIEGKDCTVVVQLGPPRPNLVAGHTGWYCPYRITGIPDKPDLKMFGGGEDAVEAIIVALAIIGAELNYRQKERLGLDWGGVEHLGFLDTDKLPWMTATPEDDLACQAINDIWSNPTYTPEERRTLLTKFFEEQQEGDD
jgi:hypothetical protein